MARYILGFLLAVGLIIIVIILILHGSSSPTPRPLSLNGDASTGTSVQFIIDSPITATSTHHDIIVNVDNIQSTITITQGYDGQIDNTQAFPMSVNAYAVFLRALMINGFTLGNNSSTLANETGHCALGDRYTYEVINGSGNTVEHYWSTSCETGNFLGDIPVIQQLFESQIPNYDSLTSNISLQS